MMNVIKGIATSTLYHNTQASRIYVPLDKISWDVEYPEYMPPYFDSDRLNGKPWADPLIGKGSFKWNSIDGNINRKSFTGNYTIDANNYPINPQGRTGIKGRGLLGRWGPNFAADPVVTRWKRDSTGSIVKDSNTNRPVMQVAVIQRRDTKMWALPGGMVDPGEDPLKTACREFLEEATNSLHKSDAENKALQETLKDFFAKGKNIINCIVSDPRNTDNAWMETSVYSFHDETGNTVGLIPFTAGDDAMNFKWLDHDGESTLYASHLDFVNKVVDEEVSKLEMKRKLSK